jgi:hypothetical protein
MRATFDEGNLAAESIDEDAIAVGAVDKLKHHRTWALGAAVLSDELVDFLLRVVDSRALGERRQHAARPNRTHWAEICVILWDERQRMWGADMLRSGVELE